MKGSTLSLKKLLTLLTFAWFGAMSFLAYKLTSIPELTNPKTITQQIEHYHPYMELFIGLFIVGWIVFFVAITINSHKSLNK